MSFISLCSLLSCADPSDRILVVLSSLPCEHYLNKCNICWSPPRLGHVMTMHCGHVGGDQVTRCAPGATCDAGQSVVTEATPAPDTGLVSHLSCPGVSEHNISVPRHPSLSPQTAHMTARLQHAPCVSSQHLVTISQSEQRVGTDSQSKTRKSPTLQQLKGAALSSTRSNEAIKHWHILGRVVVAWISLIVFSFTCVILIIILGKSLIMLL